MPSAERQARCVELAGRAPSPHNIQPARWQFAGERVELWEDTTRWLAVGDPSGRDNRIGLGMSWEGMTIALSAEGLALSLAECPTAPYPPGNRMRLVASGRLAPGAAADPLAGAVASRSSYRARFAAPTAEQQATLQSILAEYRHVAIALPPTSFSDLAQWYDTAAVNMLTDAAFAAELYEWLRFSAADARSGEDGLSAACLDLSPLEAAAASFLLRPNFIRLLNAFGLTRLVVGERDKVLSAAAVVLIHQNDGSDYFATGRAWYRFWLRLEQAGFGAVPMSALGEDPSCARKISERWPLLPSTSVLVNTMRIGAREREVPKSARLPVDRLILSATGA